MYKRLLSLISIATLLAALAFPALPAHAQSTPAPSTTNQQSLSSLILSGLWAGVNVLPSWTATTTGGSTTPTPTPTTQAPTPAPTGTTPTTPSTAGAYVALGDSVAAGVGLATPAGSPASCGRTAEAYPNAVARGMGLPLVHAACSGATIRDLYTGQLSGLTAQPAQLNAAFKNGTPQLITITAGANDVYWEQFLRTCASSANCANAASTTLANSRLKTVQDRLIYAFNQIQTRGGTAPPTVVVTGYYNPVSDACTTVQPTVTAAEVRWMTASVNALNQTIRQVADRYSFVRFAPVDFSGHDICSAQPWIQGLSSPRPIHPTADGQAVIARSVLQTLGR